MSTKKASPRSSGDAAWEEENRPSFKEKVKKKQSIVSRGKLVAARNKERMDARESSDSLVPGNVNVNARASVDMDSLHRHPTVQNGRQSLVHLIHGLDDGDGKMDVDALLEALSEHAKHRAHNRHLKRTIALMIFIIIGVVATMVGTSILGSNLSKDSRPNPATGVLSTVGGVPVKTEIVSTYATLLDLPKLGRPELAKMESIDLNSDSGFMHFKISGFLAKTKDQLTLFTDGMATVDIDSAAGTAIVNLATGMQIPVRTASAASRRRLLEEKSETNQASNCNKAGACLFTREELQSMQASTVDSSGRKLLSTGAPSYVSLTTSELSDMESLADLVAAVTGAADGSLVMGIGETQGVAIKFETSAAGTRLQATSGSETLLLTDGVTFKFEYGELVFCGDGSAAFDSVSELIGGNGDQLTFTVTEQLSGSSPSADFMIATPTLADCQKVFEDHYSTAFSSVETAATPLTGVGSRRLLMNQEAQSDGHLHRTHAEMGALRDLVHSLHADPEQRHHVELQVETTDANGRKLLGVSDNDVHGLASAVYDSYYNDCQSGGKSGYQGWVCQEAVSFSNAHLHYYKKGGNCAFVFRGSDDFGDWYSNIVGALSTTTMNGVQVHSGFATEYQRTKSWIQSKLGGCSSSWFAGHSLGGAMASLADFDLGGTSVIFASPKVYYKTYKTHVDYRMFHEDDPVAGNVFGIMDNYKHAGGSKKVVHSCSWSWWCKRTCSTSVRSEGAHADSGTWDVNIGAHSMTNYRSNAHSHHGL